MMMMISEIRPWDPSVVLEPEPFVPERPLERRAHACPVCLVPHDREIHAATLSVREWFRGRVTRNLDEPPLEPAS